MSRTAYTLRGLYQLPIYTLYAIYRNLTRIEAATRRKFISDVNAAVWGNDALTDSLDSQSGKIFDEYAENGDENRTTEERQYRQAIKKLRGSLSGR